MTKKSVFITGAQGYIGKMVVEKMAASVGVYPTIIAHDLRPVSEKEKLPGITYLQGDIRKENFETLFKEYAVNTVVHLASVVSPPKNSNSQLEYEVDVLGTEKILKACIKNGVQHIIVTSSGAAYGYHADNPQKLTEEAPIRGNEEYPYSRHKRLVEEMLAQYRSAHPQLKQLIFRPGAVLGATTDNQITNLFKKSFVPGICGSASPFVFIWDEDVAEIIVKGVHEEKTGIFNLAGEGLCSMKDLASKVGKPYVCVPPAVMKVLLFLLKKAGLSQYGPEQVRFLQYRPVLSNQKLVTEFGYKPRKTSEEVFDFFLTNNLNRNNNHKK